MSISFEMWLYFILIMDCLFIHFKYFIYWSDSRPEWMSPRSWFQRSLKKGNKSSLFDSMAIDLARRVFVEFCVVPFRERIQPTGAGLSQDQLEREFMVMLYSLSTKNLENHRTWLKKMTLYDLFGWKVRMGWYGGLWRYTEFMVVPFRLSEYVTVYKKELEKLMPSTFIFHRGRPLTRDANVDVLRNQIVIESAMQPDSNNIEI